MATLQERLDEFKKSFESGARHATRQARRIEKMHRETAQLKATVIPEPSTDS
jgi:hypothetical protein